MINKFLDWLQTPTGMKVSFYLDMVHCINVLALMLPLGYLSKAHHFGGKWAVWFLVGTAIHSLYCAQKYYSANYRY